MNVSGSSTTKIRFALSANDQATLSIYSVVGDHIRTLLRGEELPAGEQIVNWDGKDEAGGLVADGVYQYSLELGNGMKLWNKMVVLKQ
jgi:flagellar hook assembly protein FlgD